MNLTPREQQAIGVMLLWPGLQDKAYAGLLGITPRTLKQHFYTVRQKLQLAGCSRNMLYVALVNLANQLRTPGTPEITPPLPNVAPKHRYWLHRKHINASVKRRRQNKLRIKRHKPQQLNLFGSFS